MLIAEGWIWELQFRLHMDNLLPKYLMLFSKLCPLVSDERGDGWLSLQSVPAQNDPQVLPVRVATA